MSIFSEVWMYTVFSMYLHLRVHVQCTTYEKVSFSYTGRPSPPAAMMSVHNYFAGLAIAGKSTANTKSLT
jgi:hypothetical protein